MIPCSLSGSAPAALCPLPFAPPPPLSLSGLPRLCNFAITAAQPLLSFFCPPIFVIASLAQALQHTPPPSHSSLPRSSLGSSAYTLAATTARAIIGFQAAGSLPRPRAQARPASDDWWRRADRPIPTALPFPLHPSRSSLAPFYTRPWPAQSDSPVRQCLADAVAGQVACC